MFDDLRFRLRSLFRRGAVEQDLEEELQFHIDHQTQIYRNQGFSPEESLRRARIEFGGVDCAKEECREARGVWILEAIATDFAYALRHCRKRAGFAFIAVTTLAIAIAANTAVFSFVRAIVIEKLPVKGADRLVKIGQRNEAFHSDGHDTAFRYSFYQELRRHDADFEDLLAVGLVETKINTGQETASITAELVSGNYFQMLGIRSAAGRLLDERDDAVEGAASVCVVSYRLWHGRFAGEPNVIGRRILVGGAPVEIVGVSQPGFAGASLHQPRDIQMPSSMAARFLGAGRDSMGWARVLARLKPGVDRESARTRLDAIGRQIESRAGYQPAARDIFLLGDGTQGIGRKKAQLAQPLLLLLLLVAIVLLVACANLSSLLLARSVERAREIGIRLALGASRAAVIRHFLSEGLLLSIGGGAAGWVMAQVLVRTLLKLLGTEGDGLASHVRPDLLVFGYSAGVTLAAGILVSVLPAYRAAHTDPLPAIQGGAFSARKHPLATRVLVAAQIALSVILIFGAGLFVRTLRNLRSVDLGFHADRLVLAEIDLDNTTHERNPEPFFDELLRAARDLPGARAASLTQISILSGGMMSIVLKIPGYAAPNSAPAATYFTSVSRGYFHTMEIPFLAGRDFVTTDRGEGEGVAIVNQRFARQFFAGDALGKPFQYASGRRVRVVGIVGNARFRGLREDLEPIMYLPVTQWHFPRALHLQVRTAGDPDAAIAAVRALIRTIDRNPPIGRVTTMEMQIDEALTRERLLALLSTILGAIAAALVGIGVYGVVSFSVARRVQEIGIRIALGSRRSAILALFLREAAATSLLGIAAGVPLALALGRFTSSLLYGLKPGDGLTAMVAAFALVLVALAAALFPAWRAARLDAITSLRYE